MLSWIGFFRYSFKVSFNFWGRGVWGGGGTSFFMCGGRDLGGGGFFLLMFVMFQVLNCNVLFMISFFIFSGTRK